MPAPRIDQAQAAPPAGSSSTLPLQYRNLLRQRLLGQRGQPEVIAADRARQMQAATTAVAGTRTAVADFLGGAPKPIQLGSVAQASPFAGLLAFLGTMSQGQPGPQPPTPPGNPGGGGNPPAGGNLPSEFHPFQYMHLYSPTQVPYKAMILLKSGPYSNTNGGLYARPDVAAGFFTADKAFFSQTGHHLTEYLVSGYRNFQSSSPKATNIMNSDHSMGGAVDLAAGSAADLWMRAHGSAYGFGSAGAGYRWNDPGHFSFTAGGFMGSKSASGSSWGLATALDARWIALANQWWFGQ